MRRPEQADDPWLDRVRWTCEVLSRTPADVVRSLSVTVPINDAADLRLLRFLVRAGLGRDYGLSVTVEGDGPTVFVTFSRHLRKPWGG